MTERDQKAYLYWLASIEEIHGGKVERMLAMWGSFETLYYIEGRELVHKKIFTEREGAVYDEGRKRLKSAVEEYWELEKKGIRFITFQEDEYPKRLLTLAAKPIGLFVKGQLPENDIPTVAVVGARLCSAYGEQMAERIGEELSDLGIQIVSGLALGIDGASHRGALKQGSKTYGVLGCGVEICYPREHYGLFRQMERWGGLISEYVPGTEPVARHFPARNRIISGLADVIVVVEAKEKSGSLITAGFALEQGKDIFAVPGRVTDSLSAGCNQLLRDGAGVYTGAMDIAEYFGLNYEKSRRLHKKSVKGLAKNEKMVYSCLDLEPKFLEQIVNDSGLSLKSCASALWELKLNGYIVESSSQYFMKKL